MKIDAIQEPVSAIDLYNAYKADARKAEEIYGNKRVAVTGVAIRNGLDPHNLTAVELSDRAGGKCYVLCVFNGDAKPDGVSVGDTTQITGTYILRTESEYDFVILKQCDITA